jgi:hypothetical protein
MITKIKGVSKRTQIVKYLTTYPKGMTCDQLEAMLGMLHQTCGARMWELANDGILVKTGERRKTRSGSWAVVWALPRFVKG